jgi:uncharacterized membrane protein
MLVQVNCLLVEEFFVTDVPRSSRRLDSIDFVRGLVMVIMALDHVKLLFPNISFDATDVARTTPAYFFTRWITHFCAPTFVLLAGTGAFLYRARGRSKMELSWFLVTRGLWLVFLELTAIRFGLFPDFSYRISVGQVIWAIGWSMVALAVLVYLPTWTVAAFGVAMMAAHNLMDGLTAEGIHLPDWAWSILHTGKPVEFAKDHFFIPLYPLIPWIGVMAAGYGLGAIMLLERAKRRRALFILGLGLTLAFVVLRYVNTYGDFRSPRDPSESLLAGPWSAHADPVRTLLSFLNCQKYPPSLLFLLMTLGPAIMGLAIFDYPVGPVGRFVVVFGRVPLFYYLLHWGCIAAIRMILVPNSYSLGVVYIIWACLVLALWLPCYWFSEIKRRRSDWWLSYL